MTTVQNKGLNAEHLAAEFLKDKGYHILKHRYHGAGCEIDLIATIQQTLIFVEVRYRRTQIMAQYSITAQKQARLIRAAQHFLAQDTQILQKFPFIRFDVVLLSKESHSIFHIENAFGVNI
ncbi:MAG: YraN family protein [Alphaproteobacteria bacterium]|nr:YraN family protein [Alphaproteobacteria bacterium]